MLGLEIKSLRTERYATYQIEGSVQRVQRAFAGVEHYYNHDGRGDGEIRWRKCDLQWSPELSCEFGPYAVQAPATALGLLEFWNLHSTGQCHSNVQVVSVASGVADVAGIVDGPRIVYADAFGLGSDLVLELRATGLARLVRVRAGHTPQPSYAFEFHTAAQIWRLTDEPYAIDDRGPKVLDTVAHIAIGTTDGAVFLRPFLAWDGERGSLVETTIETTGYGFLVTKYPPAWWDGSTDLWMDDTSTVNVSTNDGSVYNVDAVANNNGNWTTCRTAATGDGIDGSGTGQLNVSAYYRTGGTTAFRFQRSFVDITPALSAGDTVTAVTAHMYEAANQSIADDIVMVPGTHALPPAAADYDSYTATEYARRAFSASEATGSYKTWTLNATGLAAFNKSAQNKYAFLMGDDFDNTYPCGTQSAAVAWGFNSADNASNKPYFDITYTPAATTALHSPLGQLATSRQLSQLAC